MKLTELTKKTRKITVKFLGESAKVEYRLAVVTPLFIAELKQLDSLDSIIHQVSKTVVSWDVLDENEDVIPPTEEAIRQFDIPVGFLSQVLTDISEDMSGWEKAEKKD